MNNPVAEGFEFNLKNMATKISTTTTMNYEMLHRVKQIIVQEFYALESADRDKIVSL